MVIAVVIVKLYFRNQTAANYFVPLQDENENAYNTGQLHCKHTFCIHNIFLHISMNNM